KTCFVAHNGAGVVVRMSAFPIRKDDHARPLLTDNARDLQAVLPGVFHAAVGDIEGIPPAGFEYLRRHFSFIFAVDCAATSSQLTLRQVEDAGALALLRSFEERAAAGLLNVVAMSGDCENIQSV